MKTVVNKICIYKKISSMILCLLMLISIFPVFNNAMALGDGRYKVGIELIKEHEEETSMGNNALIPNGEVIVKNGKAELKITFTSLKFLGFEGYLGNLEIPNKRVKVLTTYDKYDGYNHPKTGKDKVIKGQKYPKDVSFPIKIGETEIPITVYVPVMGELADGIKGQD